MMQQPDSQNSLSYIADLLSQLSAQLSGLNVPLASYFLAMGAEEIEDERLRRSAPRFHSRR